MKSRGCIFVGFVVFFAVDDVVVWGVGRRFGGDWGLVVVVVMRKKGSLVECGEVLME